MNLITVIDVSRILSLLDTYTLCLGNYDEKFLALKRKVFMNTSGERSLPPMHVLCHIFYVLGTTVVAAVECVTLGFPTIWHSLCNVHIPF